ncbi:recombinase family protein [Pseudomonas turukhanskensis]|uniref:Resolvase n=1 Tax=Pseudomonas turukhanskensis TaxID=1806536 RepID=A0A9W6NFS1_9PSED|nr:recombinase family protein [Pseudomonas turukhanskensis]GLK89994.1 resolvase [Pseudomonas turukhanskensis]
MTMNQQIAYRRVSTLEQRTDRQLSDTGIQFDFEFEDKCSGSTVTRPALEEMCRFVRKGDCVHVHSIDRLARNTRHLLELVESFQAKGVTLRFHKEGLEFGAELGSAGRFMLTMLGAVAEFERALIRERQKEGIEQAKQRGVYRGRPARDKTEIRKLLSEKIPVGEIARRLNCSTRTVQRVARESSTDITTP